MAGLLTQFGDSNDYLDNVNYDPLGEVLSTTFGAYGSQMVQDYTYDAGTSRLLQSITNLQTASSAADTTSYTYDDSGNITSESDAQNTGGTQTQCFSYNGLDQLTAAWTDTGGTQTAAAPVGAGIGGCNNTTPSAANIGGPAPYWETYTYDLLGDRTSETTYNTSLPASQDTARERHHAGGRVPGRKPDQLPVIQCPDDRAVPARHRGQHRHDQPVRHDHDHAGLQRRRGAHLPDRQQDHRLGATVRPARPVQHHLHPAGPGRQRHHQQRHHQATSTTPTATC